MSKFQAFLLRDKAPLEWRDPPEGRLSVIDEMVNRFYFPYLEFKPTVLLFSREHPINPDPLTCIPHTGIDLCFVVSSYEESTGSSVETVAPPPPRGRKKSVPRFHRHKVLSKPKSAPLSAGGEGPLFGQRERRAESSSSAPEDAAEVSPQKKKRKIGKVGAKSGTSKSGGAGPAPFSLEISPPPERRPLIQKTLKKVTSKCSAFGFLLFIVLIYFYQVFCFLVVVSPRDPPSSSEPSEVEANKKRLEEEAAAKSRAEREAAEAVKRANEAAAKKAEEERVAAEKLRVAEMERKAEAERVAAEKLRAEKEKAEEEAKAKAEEEAARVRAEEEAARITSIQAHSGGSPMGGAEASGVRSSVDRSDPGYFAGDVIWRPHWSIRENSRFANPLTAEEFVSQAVPPKEREYQDSLSRSQLITDICVGQALQVAAVESLKRRDEEFARDVADFNSRRASQAQREERLKSEVDRYRDRAYKSEDRVKALERDHALAHKSWTDACQATNQEMMKLKDQMQVLKNENAKLAETAESHAKVLADKDSMVAGLRSELRNKDDELVAASSQLSELAGEKEAWLKEKAGITAERASLEELLTLAQTEAENAKTLLDEGNVAQEKYQEILRWVMTEGIAGVSTL